jgi:hypothetical protein
MKPAFLAVLFGSTLLSTPVFASDVAKHHVPFKSEFNNPLELQNWQSLTVKGWPEKFRKVEVKEGNLIIEPKAAGWFEDMIGGHLYREMTGDFMLTTRVLVKGTQSDLPQTEFSLAGLFVRAPRDLTAENWQRGKENWLFLSVGTATPAGKPQLEIKTTQNSQSVLKIMDDEPGFQELRIVRSTNIFYLLQRPVGGEWKIVDEFIRPDMPKTLWVGVTAYADWGSSAKIYPDFETNNSKGAPTDNADLRASFDWIDLRPFVRPASQVFPQLATPNEDMLNALKAK